MSEPRLLEVEDRLAADASGAERDRLLERLRAQAAAVRASLDKGVPPSDAYGLRVLITALEAGQTVVTRVWTHFHRRGR